MFLNTLLAADMKLISLSQIEHYKILFLNDTLGLQGKNFFFEEERDKCSSAMNNHCLSASLQLFLLHHYFSSLWKHGPHTESEQITEEKQVP